VGEVLLSGGSMAEKSALLREEKKIITGEIV
jgi:hypothetical protein